MSDSHRAGNFCLLDLDADFGHPEQGIDRRRKNCVGAGGGAVASAGRNSLFLHRPSETKDATGGGLNRFYESFVSSSRCGQFLWKLERSC